MASIKKNDVLVADALAYAHAAYRHNDYKYIKETRRFSEPNNLTVFANKDIVRMTLEHIHNAVESLNHPSDFIPVLPTDEDYRSVEESLAWLKRYVLLGLDNNLAEFTQDIVTECNQEYVNMYKVGRISYVPEFITKDKHNAELKKTLRNNYKFSKYIEDVNKVVTGVIKVLHSDYFSTFGRYNYIADLNGNIVGFMHSDYYGIGSSLRIKAKVKSLTKNRLYNVHETRLNYVKLYKV